MPTGRVLGIVVPAGLGRDAPRAFAGREPRTLVLSDPVGSGVWPPRTLAADTLWAVPGDGEREARQAMGKNEVL